MSHILVSINIIVGSTCQSIMSNVLGIIIGALVLLEHY